MKRKIKRLFKSVAVSALIISMFATSAPLQAFAYDGDTEITTETTVEASNADDVIDSSIEEACEAVIDEAVDELSGADDASINNPEEIVVDGEDIDTNEDLIEYSLVSEEPMMFMSLGLLRGGLLYDCTFTATAVNGTITSCPKGGFHFTSYTVTYEPNPGYEFDKVEIDRGNGYPQSWSDSELATKCEFNTQDVSEIKITVYFKEATPKFTINYAELDYGKFTSTPSTCNADDTLTVTYEADQGYTFDILQIDDGVDCYYYQNSIYSTSFSKELKLEDYASTNLTITVYFKRAELTLTSDCTNGKVVFKKNGVEVTKAQIGDYITFEIVPDAGYEYVKDSFSILEGSAASGDFDTPTTGHLTMSNESLKATAKFEVEGSSQIKLVEITANDPKVGMNINDINVQMPPMGDTDFMILDAVTKDQFTGTTFKAGDKIIYTFDLMTESGKYFSDSCKFTYNGKDVTIHRDYTSFFDDFDAMDGSSYRAMAIVIDTAAELVVCYPELKADLTLASDCKNGTIKFMKDGSVVTKAQLGDYITFEIVPDAGYEYVNDSFFFDEGTPDSYAFDTATTGHLTMSNESLIASADFISMIKSVDVKANDPKVGMSVDDINVETPPMGDKDLMLIDATTKNTFTGTEFKAGDKVIYVIALLAESDKIFSDSCKYTYNNEDVTVYNDYTIFVAELDAMDGSSYKAVAYATPEVVYLYVCYPELKNDKTTYTISFKANGGSGSMDNVTVEDGTSFSLPECKFTAPEGYKFNYWSIDNRRLYGNEVITSDVTYTAHWYKIKYSLSSDCTNGTIKFMKDGSVVTQGQIGDTITFEIIPDADYKYVKDSFDFLEGNPTFTFDTDTTGHFTMTAENVKATASFEKNVTYIKNLDITGTVPTIGGDIASVTFNANDVTLTGKTVNVGTGSNSTIVDTGSFEANKTYSYWIAFEPSEADKLISDDCKVTFNSEDVTLVNSYAEFNDAINAWDGSSSILIALNDGDFIQLWVGYPTLPNVINNIAIVADDPAIGMDTSDVNVNMTGADFINTEFGEYKNGCMGSMSGSTFMENGTYAYGFFIYKLPSSEYSNDLKITYNNEEVTICKSETEYYDIMDSIDGSSKLMFAYLNKYGTFEIVVAFPTLIKVNPKYEVVYDIEGDKGKLTVNAGDKITVVDYTDVYTKPLSESQEFAPWTDKNGKKYYPGDEITVNSDIMLTSKIVDKARYEFRVSTDTSITDCITSGYTSANTFVPAPDYTEPLDISMKFYGWMSDSVSCKAGDSVMISKNTIFYPVFVENDKFYVTINPGNGEPNITTQKYKGSLFDAPEYTWTAPSGKMFDHWELTLDGPAPIRLLGATITPTGPDPIKVMPGDQIKVTASFTLTAKFVDKPKPDDPKPNDPKPDDSTPTNNAGGENQIPQTGGFKTSLLIPVGSGIALLLAGFYLFYASKKRKNKNS